MKIRYLIGSAISLIFLLQSLGMANVIPIENALEFLGQSADPLLTFISLFVSFFIIIIIDKLAEEAFKRNFNTSILDSFSNSFMNTFVITFFAFWITWITISFTMENASIFDASVNPAILNYYVFWSVLLLTFIQIIPLKYKEKKEFENEYKDLINKTKQGKLGIETFINEQQKLVKKTTKKEGKFE
ncbi:MAG: hypothetical protein NUV57_05320 [archaeon]|nr:hypothetical protein [archaeon]